VLVPRSVLYKSRWRHEREGHDLQSCHQGQERSPASATEGHGSSLNPGKAEQ
jgi:hypothetical protein